MKLCKKTVAHIVRRLRAMAGTYNRNTMNDAIAKWTLRKAADTLTKTLLAGKG